MNRSTKNTCMVGKLFSFASMFSICVLLTSSSAFAQGGQIGGGGQTGGQLPTTDGGQVDGGRTDGGDVGTADQTDTGGGGNTADGAGDGELESVDPFRLDFQIDDLRNQGFVGPTAEVINAQGFVGPPTQNSGPELAEEASVGGNVNAGRGARNATTSNVQLQQNGFVVQRQGIRARLVPSFAAPRTPGFVAQTRFQSRIVRQPVVRQLGQGVNVSVANRTATMTGFVRTDAERQILMRQLRLEPGVYQIVDQTTTAQ